MRGLQACVPGSRPRLASVQRESSRQPLQLLVLRRDVQAQPLSDRAVARRAADSFADSHPEASVSTASGAAARGDADMDHHPGRARAAWRAVDPDAYEQGYSDSYSGRNAGRAVHTTNVSCYQAGRVDGAADRREREAVGNDCSGAEEA